MSDAPLWRREVEELHVFFERWMGGGLPDDDETFLRVSAALAPELTFVSTSGRLVGREALLDGVRASHGRRPRLKIRIEEPTLIAARGDLFVVSYEEWQSEGDRTTGRRSTAVLKSQRAAPLEGC